MSKYSQTRVKGSTEPKTAYKTPIWIRKMQQANYNKMKAQIHSNSTNSSKKLEKMNNTQIQTTSILKPADMQIIGHMLQLRRRENKVVANVIAEQYSIKLKELKDVPRIPKFQA